MITEMTTKCVFLSVSMIQLSIMLEIVQKLIKKN
jgi:hypothetical protein